MKVLIADDEPIQQLLLETLLTKWGHEVIRAKNGEEAFLILQREQPPRAAILDWMMPGMDGVRICRELRALPKHPYIYILLLTAKDQRKDLVEAFQAGVDDFLAKPVNPEELKARLHAGERILDLEEQLVAANQALLLKATHDSLTGLLNRGAIVDVLLRELARALREKGSVGVILADIDHFKKINDSLGHQAGDRVLIELSRKMHSSVRVYESVGRYGGEEFLMVLPGCNLEDTRARAEQIRLLINDHDLKMSQGSIPISISAGITVASGIAEYQEVLQRADAALYRAKAGGRNRVEVATSSAETRTYSR
jgi:two-component system cell cycle response regulator